MCAAIIGKVRKRFSIKCFERNVILANHNKGKCAISQSDLGANTGRSRQTPRARCPLTFQAQNHILTQKLKNDNGNFSPQTSLPLLVSLEPYCVSFAFGPCRHIADVTLISGPEKLSGLSRNGQRQNGLHFKEKQVHTRIRFPQPIENRS